MKVKSSRIPNVKETIFQKARRLIKFEVKNYRDLI